MCSQMNTKRSLNKLVNNSFHQQSINTNPLYIKLSFEKDKISNGNARTRTSGGSRENRTLRYPKESTTHHFSFFLFSSPPANRASYTGNNGRCRALLWWWCAPPRPDAPPRAPRGRMRRHRPWPPPPLLYVLWRRRRPRTELAAARGSRGSLGAEQQGDGLRKRASSHGDEETFMACDRICACCKRVFYVFQMFHKDVASVSCGCCKSR
jgi:hypothetical protein